MKSIHQALLLCATLLCACSHIDTDERLIYVKPEAAKRAVLLEDFTGQRCVNCPLGADVISQLQQEYGDSLVIAVGIHGGPLGFAGTAAAVGLATPLGDEYYNHWQLEYQPVGLVNRHGATNYTDWARAVRAELAKTAPLTMQVKAEMSETEAGDNRSIDITVSMLATDGTVRGRLQVWVVEDSIQALQMMPDGSVNREYVHNHVLRAAVNGTWGDDYTASKGDSWSHSFTQAVPSNWNRQKLSVVAFVYNDQGVEQVVKTIVK
jgi:hypothetical protein